jgi:hypothetical protein
VYAGSALWYCQPSRNLLTKRRSVGKGQGSSSLSRDFRRHSAMVGFVVVGSTIGMPARRFFRHTWRDSSRVLERCPQNGLTAGPRIVRMTRISKGFLLCSNYSSSEPSACRPSAVLSITACVDSLVIFSEWLHRTAALVGRILWIKKRSSRLL